MAAYRRAFSSIVRFERCRVLESTPPMSCLWIWERPSLEMSAAARFLVFLLWAVKMSDFDLEGRARADVVVVGLD